MADTEHASTLAASRYATESRALLQLVQDIRASGYVSAVAVQESLNSFANILFIRGQAVVDLPRVVVIGNQSAGTAHFASDSLITT